MKSVKTEEAPARVPFSTVLLSVVGLWLTYYVLVSMRGDLVDLTFANEILWRRAVSCAIGVVITLGLWLLLRLFDARALWMKIAAALLFSLPIAVLIAKANYHVFAPVEEEAFRYAAEQRGFTVRRGDGGDLLVDIPAIDITKVQGQEPPGPAATIAADTLMGTYWQRITEVAFGRYFMLLAWCALYLALLTGEKARSAERREGEYRRAAKAAELRSLRYQVNPHFLFNTLNSLSAMVLTGKTQAAERMIQTISTFYRRSLADDPTSDVLLRDEIELQKLYLDIESVRFPMRLRAEYDIPADLEETLIPGMILQPLIENSVKHAVAPSSGQVTITLAAREEYGRLVLSVSDNGAAAAVNDETRPGFGIGLNNVSERLQARFGDEATVASGPVPDGFATYLRLPMRRTREAAAA